jgi:uncharacterized protein (TIGR03067 family)
MQAKGEDVAADEIKKMDVLFTFKGNKLTVRDELGKFDHYSVSLDPTKSPAQIDLTDLGDNAPKGICHAIYSLDEQDLKLCLGTNFNPDEPDERPREFATKKGSDCRPPKGKYLFVLQRQKK